MNEKLKKANRSAFLILIFCLFWGGTILYRTSLKIDDLTKFEGILKKSTVEMGFGNLERNYAILLDFENSEKIYGLYAGTKEQSEEKFKSLKLKDGELYQIYLDQSIISGFDGYNLGIRIIKNKGQVVFEENNKAEIVFGTIFILMGLVGSGFIYLIAKRKFKD